MDESNGRFYWLKLKRDFFKRHDICIIEGMPNGKDYILFYLKLLCESVDHEGNLRFSDKVPYSLDMLSIVTRTNVDIVKSAVQLFTELGMMEILDDGTLYMSEVQKMIGSAANNDNANRQRRFREKKKQLELQDRYVDVTKDNESKSIETELELDKEIDKEKDREEDKEIKKDRINYQEIIDLYNEICISFPSVRSLSDARKKAIRARLNNYSIDDFRRLFEMAERSAFLKGGNDRNWSANFDWLIKDSNMAKVLDGNYEGGMKNGRNGGHQGSVGEVHKPRWRIDADVG